VILDTPDECKRDIASVPECNIEGFQAEIESVSVKSRGIVVNSLDPDTKAELMAGILVTTGAEAFDAHAVEGEVAIGWSLTSKGGGRLGRFRKRINVTPNAMAMAIPAMTPPAIAGVFDLRDDDEEVGDAE
jgi:hypothetical protein